MSLRDFFAGMALQGICANSCGEQLEPWDWVWSDLAMYSYRAADAMLAEREKE